MQTRCHTMCITSLLIGCLENWQRFSSNQKLSCTFPTQVIRTSLNCYTKSVDLKFWSISNPDCYALKSVDLVKASRPDLVLLVGSKWLLFNKVKIHVEISVVFLLGPRPPRQPSTYRFCWCLSLISWPSSKNVGNLLISPLFGVAFSVAVVRVRRRDKGTGYCKHKEGRVGGY